MFFEHIVMTFAHNFTKFRENSYQVVIFRQFTFILTIYISARIDICSHGLFFSFFLIVPQLRRAEKTPRNIDISKKNISVIFYISTSPGFLFFGPENE